MFFPNAKVLLAAPGAGPAVGGRAVAREEPGARALLRALQPGAAIGHEPSGHAC